MSQFARRPERHSKFIEAFAYSAGLLLGLLAISKAFMSADEGKVLGLLDPIFQIPFRKLLWAVVVIELVVAVFCCLRRPILHKVLTIAWIATLFFGYRFGLWWIGYEKPCLCLGSLTTALAISTGTADVIAETLLVYLLVGSYGSAIVLHKCKSSVVV